MIDFLTNISWLAVGQIILIDILLGGDNAIVIALACRNLPPSVRLRGILWGTAGAIGARIILLFFASTLLELSFVKLIGGILLYWIAIKLLRDTDDAHQEVHASDRLFSAIKTIVIADVVMSIDNVVGVASVAQHAGGQNQLALMVFGILISIPIIVWGSSLVIGLINRFPLVIVLGSAMLAYIGASMAFSDSVVVALMSNQFAYEFSSLGVIIPLLNVKLSIIGLVSAASIALFAMIAWHRSKNKTEE
jgi:YjbE family integral membrane protein